MRFIWHDAADDIMTAHASEHGKLMLVFGARKPEEVNHPEVQRFLNDVMALWEASKPPGLIMVAGRFQGVT